MKVGKIFKDIKTASVCKIGHKKTFYKDNILYRMLSDNIE